MNDQLLKQYSIWEKIIECKYNLAASTVKNGLMYLKFFRLNFTILEFFHMTFKS